MRFRSTARFSILAFLLGLAAVTVRAQDATDEPRAVPVFSGSVGEVPIVEGGQTTLVSIFSPVVLVPFGEKWLIESRAAFEGDFTNQPPDSHFGGKVNKEVEYLQLDYIANKYLTVTAGRFLNPFGIYNERLYPVWIRDLQTDPLILPLEGESRDGMMLRGGVPLNSVVNLNYTTFFSVQSSANKLESNRGVGGRIGLFFPRQRLEIGTTIEHALVEGHSNRFGFHFEHQPFSIPLEVRAEYAHGVEGSGFWVEPAYTLSSVPWLKSVIHKTQLASRYQQFYIGNGLDEDLPSADTRAVEFGMNYYIADGFRAMASYGREFSVIGNQNVWTAGLSYRWVLPLGRGGWL